MTLQLQKRFYLLPHGRGVYVVDKYAHKTVATLHNDTIYITPQDKRRKPTAISVPRGVDWRKVAHEWFVSNGRESPWHIHEPQSSPTR